MPFLAGRPHVEGVHVKEMVLVTINHVVRVVELLLKFVELQA